MAESGAENRGNERLLWDCETVGMAIADRVPARERLEDEVGEEFADVLIATLRREPGSADGESLPPAEPGRAA